MQCSGQGWRLTLDLSAQKVAQFCWLPTVVFLYLQPRREERLDGLAQAMQDAKEEAEALLDVAGE